MDRERNSREGREVKRTNMAANNGLSRRRHRSNSLRDSPEEDGAMEYQETTRLRDRGISKKERDHRLSRNKRRRADRFMHGTTNRDRVGDDTSDESLEDDEEEDDDDEPGPQRMPPPNPIPNPNPNPNPSSSSVTNHHRKSFPQVTKVVRAAPYEMGFSVPKKARSAFAKRSHELISVAGGGGGGEQVHRQASTSPARPSVTASLPAPASPSSSSVSHKKKMKQMGHKLKPPKFSKSSSVQDEIEIEVAEVLYGLLRQSSRPEAVTTTSQKLESRDTNGSTTDARSRVSSPISFPPSSYPTQQSNLPQNPSSSTAPLSTVAPKRKRPRIVKYDDDSSAMFSARSGSISSTAGKVENEQKVGVSSPKLERVSGSTLENNGNGAAASDPVNSQVPAVESSSEPPESAKKESNVNLDTKPLNNESEVRDVLQSKEIASSPKKDSSSCDKKMDVEPERATETKAISMASGVEKRREENLVIDLMAPPLRSSLERDEVVDFVSDAKSKVSDVEMKVEIDAKEEDNVNKTGEQVVVREAELAMKKKTEPAVDECEPQKSFDRKQMGLDLQIDLEKHSKDNDPFTISDNKAQQTQKQQQHQSKALKIESKSEKDVQSTSIPLPMAPAGWPGLLPNLGGAAQVRPLQGVLSLDGKSVASTAAQSPDFLLSRPRSKRCTTHYYIAQNIYQHQQYSKMMWSSGAGPASLFGTTPPYNLNVMPPMEAAIVGNPLQGSFAGRNLNPTLDKGQAEVVKDKSSVASNFMDPAQKKQLVVQHAPPQIHGPAFIFHLNQQQAAAVAGNKSGVAKSQTSGNPSSSSSAQSAPGNSSSVATAATTLSFNYQGLPANEGQYLAILQNSGYPFPVGAPPHYRGATPSQALPFLNGSFYPSQMLHPSQFQQQQHLQSQSQQQAGQQGHQNGSTSSGSSSSQKHQQNQQQRLHGGGSNAVGGNSNSFPGSKNRSSQPQNSSVPLNHQVRHLEADLVVEDSPSAEDIRKAAYNNFSMQAQQKNFSAMSAALVSGGTGNHGDKQHQPQQHNSKGGPELIPAQAFAMPFGPFNGAAAIPGFDMQNHVIFQNLPEAARHGYPQMAAAVAAAQASQQKRTHQYSEETKTVSDLNTADDEKKVVAGKGTFNVGQGLVFSRPDSADRSINLGSGVIDSSAHTINLISAPSNRTARSSTSTGAAIAGAPAPNTSNSQQQQQQQQQLIQLQKHQHQQLQQQQQQQLQQQQQIHHQQQQQLQHQLAAAAVARSKPSNTTSPNAHSDRLSPNAHADHLSTSSMTGKLPNSLSGFPQTLVQGGSSAQSPQWKNSSRTSVSSGSSPGPVSNTSSLKNHHAQQQQGRPQQGHTQISFGVNNTKQGSASHWQQIPTSNQSSSPPVVGSPPGSISKSSGGSPKTTSTGSKVGPAPPLLSQQQATKSSSSGPSRKSSPVGGMNMPSILGNSHVTSTPRSNSKPQSQQQQQQQQQKQLQQTQLYFANAFMQAQTPQSTTSATTMSNASTIGYYQQRRPSEQQQQGSSNASSGMIALSPSLTLAGVTTSDPTKAVAAAAANMKGGVLPQGLLHAPQFATQSGGHPFMSFPYIQSVPSAQVKPAEQKQPAGNDNLHACWQPEKR